MSAIQDGSETASDAAGRETIDLQLEVVVIPVSDVDRAKDFYASLGWRLDADVADDQGFRIVQFTPHGSACSIQFGSKVTSAPLGSATNMYLVVPDVKAARDAIAALDVAVSEVFHEGSLGDRFNPDARVTGAAPDGATYGSFASFSDPDGNTWLLQEITTRLPGRIPPRRPRSPRRASCRRRCSARPPRMANTKREPARKIPTGRTGTPSTWSANRRARSSRREQ